MSLILQGSTSGSITLQEPAIAGNTVLDLPAVSGTVLTDTSPKAGNVIQVVYVEKTTTFSGTSVSDNGGYFIDVTGMSASITPTSASSKILIMTTIYCGSSSCYQLSYRLKRTIGASTTFPILGTSEGSRPVTTGRASPYDGSYGVYGMADAGGIHQDSPNTTSSITYQIQLGGYSSDAVVSVNRTYQFQASSGNYDTIPVSTITLMEIAG